VAGIDEKPRSLNYVVKEELQKEVAHLHDGAEDCGRE
jgi:hypothetical protein